MKTYLKRILSALILVALLYGIGRVGVVYYDSYRFVERQPYMQMQTHHSVLFKWQSPKSEIGCVRYGIETLSEKACDPEPTSYHHIALEGLEAGTAYRYEVASPSMTIDNSGRRFTTLVSKSDAVQRIWVIGDSGEAGPKQDAVYQAMMRHLEGKPLDLWLLLGDNAYRSGTQQQYNKALFKPYAELLKTLTPWAVIGNHDARRWAFYDIFEFPQAGESGGIPSGSEQFYAIESGNVHIVMLDSHEGDTSAGGAMAAWLEKDLAQVSTPWIIAVMHHPPYSDGSHKSDKPMDSWGRMKKVRENIVPILEKYGVDLVLSGHSHGYERSRPMHNHYDTSNHFDAAVHEVSHGDHYYCKAPARHAGDGTIYNVVGCSGKSDRASFKHPAMPFSYQTLGSTILEITPDTLKATFLDETGAVRDSYSIDKSLTCKDDAQ